MRWRGESGCRVGFRGEWLTCRAGRRSEPLLRKIGLELLHADKDRHELVEGRRRGSGGEGRGDADAGLRAEVYTVYIIVHSMLLTLTLVLKTLSTLSDCYLLYMNNSLLSPHLISGGASAPASFASFISSWPELNKASSDVGFHHFSQYTEHSSSV